MTRKTMLLIATVAAALCVVLAIINRNSSDNSLSEHAASNNNQAQPEALSQPTQQPGKASDQPADSSAGPATGTVAESKPQPPASGCYTLTFKHKSASGHSDRSSCGTHRNGLKTITQDGFALSAVNVNAKSLCVRVDGNPVRFERKKDLIVFGPIAGPESTVTVQYCVGKSKCSSNCKIPKDEFMDALGAAGDNGREIASAKWAAGEKDDPDASANLSPELVGQDPDNHNAPVFTDWLLTTQDAACKSAVVAEKL